MKTENGNSPSGIIVIIASGRERSEALVRSSRTESKLPESLIPSEVAGRSDWVSSPK